MKFSTVISISFSFVILPFLSHASSHSVPHLSQRTDGNGGNGSGDPQTSLTLDPAVIASGFAKSGENATAGEVASLTSTNNFINFCLTVPNQNITNGLQIAAGSCNPAIMGSIPSTANIPFARFTNPKNGDTIKANTPFTISLSINNLETGNFVNADTNFLSAPQHLNQQGLIIGHSHVVVEALSDQSTPTKFAFFQGLNNAAQGGILTANATGLPAGVYRLCSITTAANHQPVLVPIAQHGSIDDCVYFNASAGGAATPPISSSSAVSSTAATDTDTATDTSFGASTSTATSGGAGATSSTVATTTDTATDTGFGTATSGGAGATSSTVATTSDTATDTGFGAATSTATSGGAGATSSTAADTGPSTGSTENLGEVGTY